MVARIKHRASRRECMYLISRVCLLVQDTLFLCARGVVLVVRSRTHFRTYAVWGKNATAGYLGSEGSGRLLNVRVSRDS